MTTTRPDKGAPDQGAPDQTSAQGNPGPHTAAAPEAERTPLVERPRRVAVVFNPSSGGPLGRGPIKRLRSRLLRPADRAEERRQQIRAALEHADVEVAWYETTKADPGAGMAAAAAREGADLVIACGGDGTAMACATALAGGAVPLAVLPFGTGNLLALNFDIPVDLDDALEIALTCRRRRIDVGTLNDDRFALMAGMGFDAAMLRDTDPQLKSKLGPLAYVLSAVRNLRRPRRRYQLRFDGQEPVTKRGQGVLIGNVGRLQGGLPALPDAVPDDGLLDVAVLKTHTLADWATLAGWAVGAAVGRAGSRLPPRRPRLGRRSHTVVETFRASHIEITCERAQPVQVDGDLRRSSRSLVIDVQPCALTLAVPTHHAEGTAPARRDA